MKNLSAIFIIIFMALGLIIAVPTLYKGYVETGKIRFDTVSNGKWTSIYEKEFADKLPVREPGLSFWGALELLIFQEGRKGVIIGKNGWLFTDEEFTADKNRQSIIENNKNFILDTSRKLTNEGIILVITLVPAKSRVMAKHLGDYTYPDYNKDFYSQIQSFLKENSINSTDTLIDLSNNDKSFIKTDTHWSSTGAKIQAKKIAEYINDKKLFDSPNTDYALTKTNREKLDGDLTRYVPAKKLRYKYDIAPQYIQLEDAQIQQQDNNENDLFGDNTAPITLVGTSYSADKRWNFESYLKYFLKSDLYNAADEGLGPFTTMKDYLNSNEFKNIPPKLIIWEIPERYISLPEKNDN